MTRLVEQVQTNLPGFDENRIISDTITAGVALNQIEDHVNAISQAIKSYYCPLKKTTLSAPLGSFIVGIDRNNSQILNEISSATKQSIKIQGLFNSPGAVSTEARILFKENPELLNTILELEREYQSIRNNNDPRQEEIAEQIATLMWDNMLLTSTAKIIEAGDGASINEEGVNIATGDQRANISNFVIESIKEKYGSNPVVTPVIACSAFLAQALQAKNNIPIVVNLAISNDNEDEFYESLSTQFEIVKDTYSSIKRQMGMFAQDEAWTSFKESVNPQRRRSSSASSESSSSSTSSESSNLQPFAKGVLDYFSILGHINPDIHRQLHREYHLRIAYVSDTTSTNLANAIQNEKNSSKFLAVKSQDVEKLLPGTWIVIKENNQWMLKKISQQNPIEFSKVIEIQGSKKQGLDSPVDAGISAGLNNIWTELNRNEYENDKSKVTLGLVDPLIQWQNEYAQKSSPSNAEKFNQMIVLQLAQLCKQLEFINGKVQPNESVQYELVNLYRAYHSYGIENKDNAIDAMFSSLGKVVNINLLQNSLPPNIQMVNDKIIEKIIKRGNDPSPTDRNQIEHFLALGKVTTESELQNWKNEKKAQSAQSRAGSLMPSFGNVKKHYGDWVQGISLNDVQNARNNGSLSTALGMVGEQQRHTLTSHAGATQAHAAARKNKF
ncbi:MAG: hypothetical protein ABSF18_02710 [Gammaproteobacteria bacterium]|jgi:hypothetical protein